MANISATKKISRLVTQTEADNNFYMAVRILWPSSFFDTNYVIAVTVDCTEHSLGLAYPCVVTDVTRDGFTCLLPNDGDGLIGGVTFEIHAMASHA